MGSRSGLPFDPKVAARRLLTSAVTLVGVMVLTFVLLDTLPGNAVLNRVEDAGPHAMSDEALAQLEKRAGLDRAVHERFMHWAGSALRGDLGRSLHSRRRVGDEILSRLPATIELNLVAWALVMSFGLAIGWYSAYREGGAFDKLSGLLMLAVYALPAFWLALLLQHLLAVEWRIFPLFGRSDFGAAPSIGERLRHLVLPSIALAVNGLAFSARSIRSATLSATRSRAALFDRSAGISRPRVFFNHGVRHSLLMLVTLVGLALPGMVSGAVITETIFRWPGIGMYFVDSIRARDLPVVMGLTLIVGSLTIFGSLLSDGLAHLVDPRLRNPRRRASG